MADTLKIKKGKTLMVAHRGVSGIECENTAAAFVAAGNRSYAGIETDVHVSADGKFVIVHDDNLYRISGIETVIEGAKFSEISDVHLYDMEKGAYRRDLVLPTLDEYIRICRRYEKTAVLELKNRIEPKYIKKIVSEIKKLGRLDSTIFISFNFENLIDVKKLVPTQKVQFLASKWDDGLPEKLKENGFDLDLRYTELTKERLDLLHSLGITVNVWTVNVPSDGERLAEWGVDYITTNILE